MNKNEEPQMAANKTKSTTHDDPRPGAALLKMGSICAKGWCGWKNPG
jgi:hypothetical protein